MHRKTLWGGEILSRCHPVRTRLFHTYDNIFDKAASSSYGGLDNTHEEGECPHQPGPFKPCPATDSFGPVTRFPYRLPNLSRYLQAMPRSLLPQSFVSFKTPLHFRQKGLTPLLLHQCSHCYEVTDNVLAELVKLCPKVTDLRLSYCLKVEPPLSKILITDDKNLTR